MGELTDLARRLVSIPSHEDETEAGDFVEQWLRSETDADVTRDDAGNVVARRGTGGESLALVGHHDVVPPDDSQARDGEYVVSERDGRLYGRGAADMKGSLAAAMCAFRDSDVSRTSGSETESGDGDPVRELVFASFVGEEDGGVGARHAIADGFEPTYAVVAEGSTNYSGPGVTDVVVGHRGRRESAVTARGASAHASEPAAGVNAIYLATEAVDVVRGLDGPSAEVYGETLSGSVTVTEISGGSTGNVIPSRCAFTVDERTVPGGYVALERVAEADGVAYEVVDEMPPMECDDESFARAALDAAAAAQDGTPELVTKPHATDAGWLARAGTTCVVCGASEPGQAHTDHESVGLDVLERCERIYRGLAESI